MRFSHNNYSNWNICPLISLFARDANASLIWAPIDMGLFLPPGHRENIWQ